MELAGEMRQAGGLDSWMDKVMHPQTDFGADPEGRGSKATCRTGRNTPTYSLHGGSSLGQIGLGVA